MSIVLKIEKNTWDEIKLFTLKNPIASLVYTIALKTLSIYCRSLFSPHGLILSIFMFSSSIVLDISIITQKKDYKDKIIQSIWNIQKNAISHIKNFIYENISLAGKVILKNLFSF